MRNQQYIEIFCRNIRTLRERSRLSEQELAERLALPAASVAQLEKGTLPEGLELEALVRLGTEFGISLKDMFLPLSI